MSHSIRRPSQLDCVSPIISFHPRNNVSEVPNRTQIRMENSTVTASVLFSVLWYKSFCVLLLMSTDTLELVALHLLPAVLTPPMVRFADTTERKRKRSWRPSICEMLQAFVIIIPVLTTYTSYCSVVLYIFFVVK